MPLNKDIKKVLVIGSGPIVIGQAAEFDYAGTQACRALREDGIEIVLVNSNPATIMTDKAMADKIYIEPLNLDHHQAHHREGKARQHPLRLWRPDGPDPLHAAGQGGLPGRATTCGCWAPPPRPSTRPRTARCSRTPWRRSASPASPPRWSTTVEDAEAFAQEIGYPVIIRPAFTLGGYRRRHCQQPGGAA